MKNFQRLIIFFVLVLLQPVYLLEAETKSSQKIFPTKEEKTILDNLKAAVKNNIPTVITVLKNDIIPLAELYNTKFHEELSNMVSKEQSKQTATQGKTTAALQKLEDFIRATSTLLKELLNNQQTEVIVLHNQLKQIEQDAARALQIAFARAQGW